MSRHELHRRVAAVTGDDAREIARLGFQLDAPADAHEPGYGEPLDWDAAEAARRTEVARCGRGRVAFH